MGKVKAVTHKPDVMEIMVSRELFDIILIEQQAPEEEYRTLTLHTAYGRIVIGSVAKEDS